MIRDKLYIFIDGPTNKPTRLTCRISLLLTKATVIMPSLYAYGSQGNGGIPANSPLIFELELVDIKENPLADD